MKKRANHSLTYNVPPLALWIGLTVLPLLFTFFFSSQDARVSGSLSLRLLNWLLSVFPALSALNASFSLHVLLRKLAHFTLYFLLGCGLRGLSTYQKRFPAVPCAIVTGMLCAALDEFHQNFSAGRAPSVFDVALDTWGVTVGCGLVSLSFFLVRKTSRGASA
ncbi:MAG: VanZ family protein [Oscillibacter sp.]|nr:VanZ family protein [Oscillibacter sp.]